MLEIIIGDLAKIHPGSGFAGSRVDYLGLTGLASVAVTLRTRADPAEEQR
jgi:hypothetical protein